MQNIFHTFFSSSSGMGIPRYVNLAHPLAMGGFAFALLLIAAGAFLAGSQVGKRQAMNDPQIQSAAWALDGGFRTRWPRRCRGPRPWLGRAPGRRAW